mgnify:CR=1 FL=1
MLCTPYYTNKQIGQHKARHGSKVFSHLLGMEGKFSLNLLGIKENENFAYLEPKDFASYQGEVDLDLKYII